MMDRKELLELERLLLIRASHRCSHCAEGDEPVSRFGSRWREHRNGLTCRASDEWCVLAEVRMERGITT